MLHVELEDLLVLFLGPAAFYDVGVQYVYPSLTALLAGSPDYLLRSLGPLRRSFGLDPFHENRIFIAAPGSFD